MKTRIALACLLILVASGCSGRGMIPVAQSPTAQSSFAAAHAGAAVKTVLRIHIPKRRHHKARYVSTSTQSGALTVAPAAGCTACTAGFALSFGLTASSPNCQPATSGSGLQCNIPLVLAPGSYTGSLSLYDGPIAGSGPTGKVLSENQAFPIAIVQGNANAPSVTLDGVPVNYSYLSLDNNAFFDPNNQYVNQTLIEFARPSARARVEFYTYDPDGNVIVGPGSPTFTFKPAGGYSASALGYNDYLFTAPSSVVKGTSLMSVTINSSACSEPGAYCNLIDKTKFLLGFQPVVASANASANKIVLTEGLHQLTTITAGISNPSALAFDASGNLFVANAGNDTVTEYAQPYSGGPALTISHGLASPALLAIDKANNLFVGNGGSPSVVAYPATNYATTAPNTISLPVNPSGLALDSKGKLWIALVTGVGIARYPTPLTSTSSDQSFFVINPTSIALDALDDVFVISDGSNIAEYDNNGGAYKSGTGATGLSGLSALAAFNAIAPGSGGTDELAVGVSSGGAQVYGFQFPGLFPATTLSQIPNAVAAAYDQYGMAWFSEPSYGAVSGYNAYDNPTTVDYFLVSGPGALAVYPGP